jgi:hypothetical protein
MADPWLNLNQNRAELSSAVIGTPQDIWNNILILLKEKLTPAAKSTDEAKP